MTIVGLRLLMHQPRLTLMVAASQDSRQLDAALNEAYAAVEGLLK